MSDYKAKYEELQNKYRELESANSLTNKKQKIIDEVLHDISVELDINTILDLVAVKARELIKAETLVVPIINEEQQRYYYLAASGKNADSIIGTSFPINVGMCGWVLTSKSPLLFGKEHEMLMGQQTEWEDSMESALLVPLISRGRIIGGLSGLGKQGETSFDNDDKTVLELFARHISLVIDNAIIFKKHEEEKERAEVTLRSIGDAVITTNTNGEVTSMNPVAERLTGWSEQDAMGLLLPDIYRVMDTVTRRRVKNPVDSVLKQGEIVEISSRKTLLNKDGTEFHITDNAAPIKDNNNMTIGVILVFHDITKHRQTEEALRRSQKMDAIGQLSGGIAHDFNNILSAILGNIELLELQASLEDKTLKRFKTIKHSAQRAADLTRQLLGFSRMTATSKKATNINQVIEDMQTLVVHSLTPQVEVKQQLADDLWLTEIDRGDFEDVLLNLVLNARDAMPGGGRVTVETSNCSLDESYCALNPDVSPGDYIELAVSDSGIGISAADQERIFEPFFTTKPQGKGTGLGLAMVFGFVKRSRGNIKIYSETDIGSTFRLYLPRASSKKMQAAADGKKSLDMPRGNETILVVDDEIALLKLVEETLQLQGYNVITAENAANALQKLAEVPEIHMLFSDVVMPGGMNGYELAEKVNASQPGVKVMLTSGYTEMAMARNGQARFNATLLSKPYTLAKLSQRVREMLDEA